jgi:nucleoside-diphosphate kinase
MDRTLILVKPDAFARGLTGEIIARFERKGLTIVAMKHMTVSNEAVPGSIRGEYGLEVQTNLVHGSDSNESSEREIALFFPEQQG